MKRSSKPISSPCRIDKFPPLTRFLRANVGSRSRGRSSRASPMFVRRKNDNAAAVEAQEPSSPKVTCMGQVRVRQSKRSGCRRHRRLRWCSRIWKSLFCHHIVGKIKPRWQRPVWSKWARFFKTRKEHLEEQEEEKEEEDDEDEISGASVSISCAPPKNALLLTRCRSAPYRPSSLAYRILDRNHAGVKQERGAGVEDRTPTQIEATESKSKIETTYPDENRVKISRFVVEFEGWDERGTKPECSAPNELERSSVQPSLVTRCKSAPARRFGMLGAL